MKIFPACSEGFRRVSILAAILTFLFAIGYLTFGNEHALESGQRDCVETYVPIAEKCQERPKPEVKTCVDETEKQENECIAAFYPGVKERFEYWGIYVLGGLVFAYLVALAIRTSGWVVQGFTRGGGKAA
jgi:hypothetical protein